MIKEIIRSAVSRHSSLSINGKNENEYGVMKTGFKGSLWIGTWTGKKYKGTRIQTTGAVASILDEEIERLQSSDYIGEHHGYKYWYISDPHGIEQIIDIFGRS